MYQRRNNTISVLRIVDNAIIGPENEEDWQAYQDWLSAGNTTVPAIEPSPLVPYSVPLWAVRTILADRGLLDAANTAVEAFGNAAVKAVWEYGNMVDRNSPALLALAQTIGVVDELDALFIEAGNLRV